MFLSRDVSIEIQLRRGVVEMTGKEDKKEEWTVRLDMEVTGSVLHRKRNNTQRRGKEKQVEEHLIDRELNENAT